MRGRGVQEVRLVGVHEAHATPGRNRIAVLAGLQSLLHLTLEI